MWLNYMFLCMERLGMGHLGSLPLTLIVGKIFM